ncbi:MAG TPA: 3-oxoacyl-ACP reductase family protein [Dongiaceae bacterium]|jgi:3-oxoacyl-[acyl-carrier protein] reductase|nr:3-oxoacyl-ACP reductase family protein [Dongiaceae bacterium]
MQLKDKVAIVTGSSRGIGKAVAERFAREGARIVVNYVRNKKAADAVAAAIRKAGGEAVAVKADVSKRADAERLIKSAVKAFGRLDIVVSNAGIVIDRPFIESTDEDWIASIENNLHGFFNVCQAALKPMLKQKWGRIIATCSCITEVADFGGNKFSVCTASKGGITAMLRPIAAEVAREGVTVNGVSPGYIATEMLGEIDPAGLEATLGLVPMRRFGKPEEIAAAMAFLASEDAAYITGQVLRVNGGLSMG